MIKERAMLELYHGGHTTCSRKARLCLREKGLAYTSHFLNLRGFEQHTPAYLKLNPNGVVPKWSRNWRLRVRTLTAAWFAMACRSSASSAFSSIQSIVG